MEILRKADRQISADLQSRLYNLTASQADQTESPLRLQAKKPSPRDTVYLQKQKLPLNGMSASEYVSSQIWKRLVQQQSDDFPTEISDEHPPPSRVSTSLFIQQGRLTIPSISVFMGHQKPSNDELINNTRIRNDIDLCGDILRPPFRDLPAKSTEISKKVFTVINKGILADRALAEKQSLLDIFIRSSKLLTKETIIDIMESLAEPITPPPPIQNDTIENILAYPHIDETVIQPIIQNAQQPQDTATVTITKKNVKLPSQNATATIKKPTITFNLSRKTDAVISTTTKKQPSQLASKSQKASRSASRNPKKPTASSSSNRPRTSTNVAARRSTGKA